MTEEEFENLVYTNQSLIWKVCKTYFRNEEEQKDLFQDILLKLWKGRNSFQNQSKITTWMYRICLNQAIDNARKKKPDTTLLTEGHSDRARDTGGSVNGKYDLEALYLAIHRLNPVEKAMIHLHLEQESYRQIAEIIGISEKNVGVRLVRIKEKLKHHYLDITS